MKKIITLGLLLLTSTMIFAGEMPPASTEPVEFISAEVEAFGSANTAIASGFESLFTNPAGLSRKGGELVFGTMNIYSDYMIPEDSVDFFEALANTDEDDLETFFDNDANAQAGIDVAQAIGLSEGVNTTFNMGVGLAAFGIGLGVMTDVSLDMKSDGIDDSLTITRDNYDNGNLHIYVDPTVTSALVLGISHGFNLGGATLHIGADAKAIARVETVNPETFDVVDMLTAAHDLSTSNMMLSTGVSLNAGAILDLPFGFSAGVSAQNINGTEMKTLVKTIADLDASDPETIFNELQASNNSVILPMQVVAGVGYTSQNRGPLKLKAAADYTIDMEAESILPEDVELIDQIRAGAELTVMGIAKIRGGINQGQVVAGVGVNLLLVEANATFYGPRYDAEELAVPEKVVVGVKFKL